MIGRLFGSVCALGTLSLSGAQYFELRAVSGATLVGNTFRVTAGAPFTVEVWLRGLTAPLSLTTYHMGLAYDRTNGVGTSAGRLDQKLSVGGFTNLRTEMDLFLAVGVNRAAATPTGAGGNYGFITGALRPYVCWSAIAAPVGTTSTVPSGDTLFARYTVRTTGMVAGETYGDDLTEAGLFIANQGGTGAPSIGGSGLITSTASENRRLGTLQKYAVTVVPEPATMATLGLGMIAAFRLRRSGQRSSLDTTDAS